MSECAANLSMVLSATLLLFVHGLYCGHSHKMVIVEAGVGGRIGPDLIDGLQFCPQVFSSRGFSIICLVPKGPVEFRVNGKRVRKELYIPYALAGDTNGNIKPWKAFPSFANVVCKVKHGAISSARVHFHCPTASPRAPFMLPVAQPAYFGADHLNPISAEATSKGKETCVVINGSHFMTEIATGWTVEGNTITFEKDVDDTAIVPPSSSCLQYRFIAPKTATYAITLDMTTRGFSEHNDVWFRFSGGLNLRCDNQLYRSQKAYVKAFHNREGRAIEAFAVNIDQWSMSTARTLLKGYSYSFFISGRSTMVSVHRILLFPCTGIDCQCTSKVWKDAVAQCSRKKP